jgi:TPP-dependent pyruvate/acetoin dehydrogenase alpha subunit
VAEAAKGVALIDKLEAYRRMYLIRRTDEVIADRYPEQKMQTPVHLSIGQEAASVGVVMAMEDAHVFAGHRSHAQYLAKGGSLDALVAELYGRESGCCGGRGGSMHIHDRYAGFMGSYPIVGDAASLAVGSAFAARLSGETRQTIAFGGDAVVETGQFWEALNFAALQELQILFVVENNQYATSTPLSQRQPQHNSIWHRTLPFVNSNRVWDGDGVEAVYGATKSMVVHGLPAVLEVRTYRYRGHVTPGYDWDMGYRTEEEVRAHMAEDPLDKLAGEIPRPDLQSIRAKVQKRVHVAFQRAEAAEWPA